MDTLTRIGRVVRNTALRLSDIEIQVLRATSSTQAWGPTTEELRPLTEATFQYQQCSAVMRAIWARLTAARHWRTLYKILLLLEHLVRNGGEPDVLNNCRQHTDQIAPLEQFKCSYEDGRDVGLNVRERASKFLRFLARDDDTLRAARSRALFCAQKCKQGMASDFCGVATAKEEEKEQIVPSPNEEAVTAVFTSPSVESLFALQEEEEEEPQWQGATVEAFPCDLLLPPPVIVTPLQPLSAVVAAVVATAKEDDDLWKNKRHLFDLSALRDKVPVNRRRQPMTYQPMGLPRLF